MQPHATNVMDWDTGGLPEAPSAPENLQQTGLSLGFLNNMILRTLYTRGAMLGLDLAKYLCLPFKVIEESLNFLNQWGGEIYVPFCFVTENQIITVFDKAVHQPADGEADNPLEDNEATIRRLLNTGTVDPRWVRIRRPVIITGGELNLAMLDLRYTPDANFSQAPLHAKANAGIFPHAPFARRP